MERKTVSAKFRTIYVHGDAMDNGLKRLQTTG
jgi:hypothetical protein